MTTLNYSSSNTVIYYQHHRAQCRHWVDRETTSFKIKILKYEVVWYIYSPVVRGRVEFKVNYRFECLENIPGLTGNG